MLGSKWTRVAELGERPREDSSGMFAMVGSCAGSAQRHGSHTTTC